MSFRSTLLIALALGLAVAGFYVATQIGAPRLATYYRVVDDSTIAVGTTTGPREWTRVTSVSESDSAIMIEIKSLSVPFVAGTGVGRDVELTVQLSSPLGERVVQDGFRMVPTLPLPSPTPKP
jgi:hypothetical protein